MNATAESRREKRFRIEQIVEVEMAQETFFAAKGRDLSYGGMRIDTGYAIEPHSRIFTMLNLGEEKDAPVIKVEGIVMHVAEEPEGFSCGIQFTGMSPDDTTKLSEFIKSCTDECLS